MRLAPLAVILLATACSAEDFRPVGAATDAQSPAHDAGGGANDAGPTCVADLRVDPNHCGACGRSCMGGNCVDGACSPLVLIESVGSLGAIAVDQTFLYFTVFEGTEAGVYRLDKHARAPAEPQLVLRQDGAFDMAHDGDTVVFSNWSAEGGVYRVGDGGATRVAASPSARALTVDADGIFFVTNYGKRVDGFPFARGETVPLATESLDIGFVATGRYYALWSVPGSIRATWKLGGKEPVTVLDTTATVGGLVVDGSTVYFTDRGVTIGDNVCLSASLDLATLAEGMIPSLSGVVSLPEPCAAGLTADTDFVYWTTEQKPDGAVRRMHKKTRERSTVVAGLERPNQIVADGTALYWVSTKTPGGPSSITRLVK